MAGEYLLLRGVKLLAQFSGRYTNRVAEPSSLNCYDFLARNVSRYFFWRV